MVTKALIPEKTVDKLLNKMTLRPHLGISYLELLPRLSSEKLGTLSPSCEMTRPDLTVISGPGSRGLKRVAPRLQQTSQLSRG